MIMQVSPRTGDSTRQVGHGGFLVLAILLLIFASAAQKKAAASNYKNYRASDQPLRRQSSNSAKKAARSSASKTCSPYTAPQRRTLKNCAPTSPWSRPRRNSEQRRSCHFEISNRE